MVGLCLPSNLSIRTSLDFTPPMTNFVGLLYFISTSKSYPSISLSSIAFLTQPDPSLIPIRLETGFAGKTNVILKVFKHIFCHSQMKKSFSTRTQATERTMLEMEPGCEKRSRVRLELSPGHTDPQPTPKSCCAQALDENYTIVTTYTHSGDGDGFSADILEWAYSLLSCLSTLDVYTSTE